MTSDHRPNDGPRTASRTENGCLVFIRCARLRARVSTSAHNAAAAAWCFRRPCANLCSGDVLGEVLRLGVRGATLSHTRTHTALHPSQVMVGSGAAYSGCATRPPPRGRTRGRPLCESPHDEPSRPSRKGGGKAFMAPAARPARPSLLSLVRPAGPASPRLACGAPLHSCCQLHKRHCSCLPLPSLPPRGTGSKRFASVLQRRHQPASQ